MDIEERTSAALSEASYEVSLGGRRFRFRPMSLSDREAISALASGIAPFEGRDMSDGELLTEAVRYGRYGRRIASIVATGAHVRGFAAFFRRRLIFRRAYRDASVEELTLCMKRIFDHVEPAFFLSIIISLSRQNMLKPTKGTEATVPG
jgi:hypothetical protein